MIRDFFLIFRLKTDHQKTLHLAYYVIKSSIDNNSLL